MPGKRQTKRRLRRLLNEPSVLDQQSSVGLSQGESTQSPHNPKHLMGRSKLPLFSVVPPSSFIYEAAAMRYGAYEAKRKDGQLGYGPYNWRRAKVVASIYIDAAVRHIMDYWDGEDLAPDSLVHHLGHLKATIGVLIDAIETGNVIDDRPPKGTGPSLLEMLKQVTRSEERAKGSI